MLACEDLDIRQGDFSLRANFGFAQGQVTALIGPSGAGKSTLLSAIGGFIKPQNGRICWQGTDLSGKAPGDRPISILFQDHNLFPHLTAAQNVGLALRLGLRLSAADQARIVEVLAKVGLDGLGRRKPAALSGGQQSRVALARVLMSQTPVILLDEPFSALGPGLRDEMLDLVKAVLAGSDRTLVMVTHAPEDARRIADQVVFVDDGIASAPVDTETLFQNPPAALAAYLG